ncbi:ATP synthase gamma subunit [Candidatus Methylobacter favarea]|uniref:ATP synthase gamma subunit n=1 Tax=Candidatus Methylobacter favarea TaxID=2707345 RepID=A0A8S0YAC0_9GAMM|nr:F0F1 ATP synthase subunit gamma [Candidatus Methylobacter favarea]CAA9891555.1 ATP synthase gamma subunit [Candidatus Methylobacter favarea]
MSQSHELRFHITQLEEIRSILNAMKNLAFMEIHKLSRFQTMQGKAVANIENAALDFLSFNPELAIEEDYHKHIAILVGTERGFCGDFNKSLVEALNKDKYSGVIAVGSRLANKLSENPLPIISEIAGANVAEEVPSIINQLINTLSASEETGKLLGLSQLAIRLTVIYHDYAVGFITQRQLFPPFPTQQKKAVQFAYPPILNLEAAEFYTDLISYYLFAALHEVFYISLMAENNNRLRHLEGAIMHLDDETVNLHRKLQIYRQEEITEEIEVILLNSPST